MGHLPFELFAAPDEWRWRARRQLLLGLLPREQATHHLPCPSKYHEYDNPTLLEKCKRDGKEAQLLCQTAGNEPPDAIGSNLVGTWNVVGISGALGEFQH